MRRYLGLNKYFAFYMMITLPVFIILRAIAEALPDYHFMLGVICGGYIMLMCIIVHDIERWENGKGR